MESVSVPVPFMTTPPAPLTRPASVTLPAFWIVRSLLRVVAALAVIVLPEAMSSATPPETVRVLVPALPKVTLPPEVNVRGPLKATFSLKVLVPVARVTFFWKVTKPMPAFCVMELSARVLPTNP